MSVVRYLLFLLFCVLLSSLPVCAQNQNLSGAVGTMPATKVSMEQFLFELQDCKIITGGVACQFTIKNVGPDSRRLTILDSSRMIDDLGNEYPVITGAIGKGSSSVLIYNIVTRGSTLFGAVDPKATSIQVLRLVFRVEGGGENSKEFPVDFRDYFLRNFTTSQLQSGNDSTYDNFLASVMRGEQITFLVKHRHPGLALGMDVDLCEGKLILTKDFLEFQGSPTSILGRAMGYHDFKVSLSKISNIEAPPEKFGKLFMKVALAKKDGKEEQKDFNFYPNEVVLKNTGIQSPYYQAVCDRGCIDKATIMKRLIEHVRSLSVGINAPQ